MGNACSAVSELPSNDYLRRLCSSERISENDPFWNALLAFSLCGLGLSNPRSSDAKLLEDTVAGMCKNFSINNQKTRNLNTFVRTIVKRFTQLHELDVPVECGDPVVWQTANALCIVRILCKYYFENLSADLSIEQFCEPTAQGVSHRSAPVAVTDLMQLLIDIMLGTRLSEDTLLLHFEVINILIVLLSCYIYHAPEAANVVFYTYLMNDKPSSSASEIVKTLLSRCIYWNALPLVPVSSAAASLGANLLSLLTIGFIPAAKSQPVDYRREFGGRCLALLLVLTNHTVAGVEQNPYRKGLREVLADEGPSMSEGCSSLSSSSVLAYEDVYRYLCDEVAQSPPSALLLYMLVQENQAFRTFALSRADPERLVLPLLAILRGPPRQPSASPSSASAAVIPRSSTSHHVYIALIVLLMLSEDDGFGASLPVVGLDDVSVPTRWPGDDLPMGGSLADAVVLVLLRSLRRNMIGSRDHYLHTNCLAILANLSSKLNGLHQSVCQTLVAFLAMLVRRHGRLQTELQLAELTAQPCRNVSCTEGTGDSEDFAEGAVAEQLSEGVAIIEEVLRMLVEILESCLAHTLHQNIGLVHAMLCERQLFDRIFKLLTADAVVAADIRTLLDYFLSRLPASHAGGAFSAAAVVDAIAAAARTYRVNADRKLPELRFRYVEEADREQFFVPYVWSLVCNCTDLYFNSSKIKLKLP